ncbi:MAG: acyl-CoA dehydratase activase [Desulfobacterales bacterium]
MTLDRNTCVPGKLRSLGICLGASTISVVQVEKDVTPENEPGSQDPPMPQILAYSLHTHEGNPKDTLMAAVATLDLNAFDRVVATGRRFRKFLELTSIPEPEAVEYAYRFSRPPGISCPAVVSAGGETFMAYVLNRSGEVARVLTGNKCASGTGEFLLQQLRRMNVSMEEAAQWAAEETPHPVSGRCSVFCKSDCTHATNKGIPKSRVAAGLCQMMANKILELLKKVERKNIMITGGTAQNRMMIEYLGREIPGLIVPETAAYFEALGAALWALEHETAPPPQPSALFRTEASQFQALAPLDTAEDLVTFTSVETGMIRPGDECILGLDVGSTTTKAVLLRCADEAIVASVYLRTDGDPVGASRNCYRSVGQQIADQLDPKDMKVVGLGVCGSGRQIAGLHALTDNVINEIIAHATAAVHFDPHVDTIFEIGGQDAKYTYITNGVPSDYAMNEACSAGTGSFLEESAYESLGVQMEDIADIAMQGKTPPNFNDQCAAFISSDIKNAIHEGVGHNDIVAGLVYSICMNYTNRVKGNRPVGEKIYMQGGVCYNRAVPLAMAALVGKPIIVPPEPGLMGAYGVALEVKNRINVGLKEKQHFDLGILANREVTYGESFQCKGGAEKCDRRCDIARITLEGNTYAFGGACNRYYNIRSKIRVDAERFDLVKTRQRLIFETYGVPPSETGKSGPRGRIGINRSFLTNTYYPLYSTFFSILGLEPVLPDSPSQEGIDRRNAAFCYPGELSHGFFFTLLEMENPPEFIFLPHFKAVAVPDDHPRSVVCPLLQGEPFYLRAAFQEEISALEKKGTTILTPLIDLTGGLSGAREALIAVARQMGINRKEAKAAFQAAAKRQEACQAEMTSIGKEALCELEADPEKMAVVLFSRSYSGFVEEAHMGIPHKLATRGVLVIPYDFLPIDDAPVRPHMYWGMGRLMLKAAARVKDHPQLFGTYITNFSCGPDSFLLGYFRQLMDRKPSLTLELDSHSADAGLETRIEAFLDIVVAYRHLLENRQIARTTSTFIPARMKQGNGVPSVVSSSGEIVPLTDKRVKLLIPSMGKTSSESLGAVFRGLGYQTYVHPPSDEKVLKLGRANTSCKECLPLLLTTGTLLNYIQNEKKADEIVVYLFATGSGPCRFGQYASFMEDLVKRLALSDVALMRISSDNSYAGLGRDANIRGLWAIVISDVMEDIRSMILANAANPVAGVAVFDEQWARIQKALEQPDFSHIEHQLSESASLLSRIPMKRPPESVPRILLAGEIFVRRDSISRQHLTEHLAEGGFATICAPVTEWMRYCDYNLLKQLDGQDISVMDRLKLKIKMNVVARYEKRIKATLSTSGLVHAEPIDIAAIIDNAAPFISPHLAGEAVLTVGGAIADVASHVCGVIAIGPFGCMPNRLSEAILNEMMTAERKMATDPDNQQLRAVLSGIDDLPFLAIESDGSPFPQLIHAKIEALCLRANRLHNTMQQVYHASAPLDSSDATPQLALSHE